MDTFSAGDFKAQCGKTIMEACEKAFEVYSKSQTEARINWIKQNRQLKAKYFEESQKRRKEKPKNENVKIIRRPPCNSRKKTFFTPNFIPKNGTPFYFPIKDSFISPNNFELNYSLPFKSKEDFEKKKEIIKRIAETDLIAYPDTQLTDKCLKIEDDNLTNFLFLSSLKALIERKVPFTQGNILRLVDILNETIFKTDYQSLYNSFMKLFEEFFKKHIKEKERLSMNKFVDIFCPICNKYICQKHFYNSLEIHHPGKECYENVPDEFNVTENNFVKLSPTYHCLPLYSSEKDEKILTVEKLNIKLPIKHKRELISKMEKEDLFSLLNLVQYKIITNANVNKILKDLFWGRYSEEDLKKIIFMMIQPGYKHLINEYLVKETNEEGKPLPICPKIGEECPVYVRSQVINPDKKINVDLLRPEFTFDDEGKIVICGKDNYKPECLESFTYCNHTGSCEQSGSCVCKGHFYCNEFCSCSCFKYNTCKYYFPGCDCEDKCSRSERKCFCNATKRQCIPGYCRCCSEPDHCENMDVILNKPKQLYLAKSTIIDSNGVFAGEPIKKGDFLGIYEGEIIENEEMDRRGIYQDLKGENYGFNLIDKEYDVDAERFGNITRYVNHAVDKEDEPNGRENCRSENIYVKGDKKVIFLAKKDIEEGEELFINYGMTDENGGFVPEWYKESTK